MEKAGIDKEEALRKLESINARRRQQQQARYDRQQYDGRQQQ